MIEPLAAAACERWVSPGDGWVVVTEHRGDTRIADLVLARLDEAAVEERIASGCERPLSRPELVVIRAMRNDCGTKLPTLAERTRLTTGAVMRVLRRLETDEAVERSLRGSWHPTFAYRPLVTRFISFEAKRSDWRRALAQARAHRLFANEAYVAFDPSYAGRFEQRLPYYKTSGIGLVAVGAEPRGVRRILRGRSGRPLDAVSAALAGEQVWGRLVGVAATPLPQTRLPGAAAQTVDQVAPRLLEGRSRTLARLLSESALPARA